MTVEPRERGFAKQRKLMVKIIAIHAGLCTEEIGRAGLSDRVMKVMARVPRHQFVPVEVRNLAYEDMPLPIGCGKTVSQPFIVALMTDQLAPEPDDKVLEIGTGLGYQTAILAELADQVYSIEIIEQLASTAEQRLLAEGYDNIQFRIGDGSRGWPDHVPFDKIIVTAAPERMPHRLLKQLKPGGRMVLPVGSADEQRLVRIDKGIDGVLRPQELIDVRFSALTVSH